VTRLLVLFALVVPLAGCKKKAEPEHDTKPAVATMSASEIQRSRDACATYVAKICACASADATTADLSNQCELAKALPEAVRIGLEVAASPDSGPDIVEQSYASVRKTVAECIEQTAKLPSLGCN
jgi:hypothetical protein